MGEVWRLLRGTGRPAENMALDAAMTWAVGEGLAPPTLRLYRWDPPAVSLGYAQRREIALNLEACARSGLAVVSRPTGGRAVLHAGDLTYAVAVPRRGLWAGWGVAATCRRIHEAVAAGLRRLGVVAEVAGVRPASGARHGDERALCFTAVSAHEITVAGRKLVGSAQRRFRDAILQHGSIPVIAERARLAALVSGDPGEAVRALEEAMVSLEEVLGGAPDVEAVATAVAAGFAGRFHLQFAEHAWSPAERALGARLEAAWHSAQGAPALAGPLSTGRCRYLDTPGGV